jgi:Flp pilus assembly protein TadG
MLAAMGKITAFRRFAKNEDGSATIEAVLWLPMFFAFFALLVDVSLIFHGQSQVLRITQDANRSLSLGRIDSATDTELFIESRLADYTPNAQAVTTVDNGLITTSVAVPISDLEILGLFGALSNATLTIWAEHLVEY